VIPVSSRLLERLDLHAAVTKEAAHDEPQLPATPGTALLKSSVTDTVRWLQGQLRAGMSIQKGLTVPIPKLVGNGIRHVAIWGLPERIVYRALRDLLRPAVGDANRSKEAHRAFVEAPIEYARRLRSDSRSLIDRFISPWPSSEIEYVVVSDITAFYDYVDHEVLSNELLNRTGDYEAVNCLVDLLTKTLGRKYGLPQLLGPSDDLAEVYVDVVQRDMTRRGWPTWHYNDDFRVAVKNFSDAKAAIEDLASCARSVGLSLNDLKTTTPSFIRYVEQYGPSEYDDADSDWVDPRWAVSVIQSSYTRRESLGKTNGEGINLSEPTLDDVRNLRSALTALAKNAQETSVGALGGLTDLVSFVPALTPSVLRYLQAVALVDRTGALRAVDDIRDKTSLSAWQRVWLMRCMDDLRASLALTPESATDFLDWVSTHRDSKFRPLVRAEAAYVLAGAGRLTCDELVHALDEEPAAVAPWYLLGLRRLRDLGVVDLDRFAAVRDQGGIHRALLSGL
jgi:hypothetical protein